MKKKTFAEVKNILRQHEVWPEAQEEYHEGDVYTTITLVCDCGWVGRSFESINHLEGMLEKEWNS